MTILGGGFGPSVVSTPTALQVIQSVSDDFLQRIAPEDPIMLDYVNRMQLQILRAVRWQFILSPPQRFVTQAQQSDYWVGPLGTGPDNIWDTGLSIQNIGPIKTDTFFDRTNYRLLKRTQEQLLADQFAYRDGSSRPGIPRTFRCAPDTPNVINLYPAPDNQNNFQPVPEAPACTNVTGGALPARIYFVRTTFVDSLGNESSASSEARVFVPEGSLVVVQPPVEIPDAASGIQYNRWNVYLFNAGTNINVTTGSETLANASPMANSVEFTEPATGFVTTGQSYPTANAVEEMGGYLIEFRYYAAKPQVTSLNQNLVIPMDYFDVMVAGTNYFIARFLRQDNAVGQDDAEYWKTEFMNGITGMVRDKNMFPKGPEFMKPDAATNITTNYYGYESWDPWFMPTS